MDPSQKLASALRPLAARIGRPLAKLALERGLAVTAQDGTRRPIPVTATPLVLSEAVLRQRLRWAEALSSATLKMGRALMQGAHREPLVASLSPLERRLAEQSGASLSVLATTRVDFFAPEGAPLRALEVNTTIPAMQGYSDIAVQAFLEVVGAAAGLSADRIAQLERLNGSNAAALLESLQQAFFQRRGRRAEHIALLCRRHDAQISELEFIARRFQAEGLRAEVVFPDQLELGDHARVRGQPFDLVYRHLFVRRMEDPSLAGADRALALLTQPPPQTEVFNPPSSQLEVKATFAWLSVALEKPDVAEGAGLSDGELEAMRACVPWTRLFRPGPTTLPDGQAAKDLVEAVCADPNRFVLKRSWDYGGRAVFVGATHQDASFQDRVRAAYQEPLSWRELCRRTLGDPRGGGYVVQERIPLQPTSHLLCSQDAGVTEAALYVDFSAYASVGLERSPAWGGVCRGSISPVVNIVGGGGVLPLLTEPVAQALLAALPSTLEP